MCDDVIGQGACEEREIRVLKSLCVCVCKKCVCVCVCVFLQEVCVCVCVCFLQVVFVYMFVCVFVQCVCVFLCVFAGSVCVPEESARSNCQMRLCCKCVSRVFVIHSLCFYFVL